MRDYKVLKGHELCYPYCKKFDLFCDRKCLVHTRKIQDKNIMCCDFFEPRDHHLIERFKSWLSLWEMRWLIEPDNCKKHHSLFKRVEAYTALIILTIRG